MKKRILTACIGVPFLIAVLAWGGWLSELLTAFMALIALYESYRALRTGGYHVCVWGAYAAAVCIWPFSRLVGKIDPMLFTTAAMGISITGVLLSEKPTFPNAAATIYPIFTVLLPFSMFMMMQNQTFGRVSGKSLVFMTFAVAFAGDAAAYFGGKALGKHKLCPQISPNKTVEGSVFYLIGSIAAALATRAFYVHVMNAPMPGIPAAVLLGLLGAVAGQIGDLCASLLKRHCGIKDYGRIFPGHGGVMDRFDSAIFTMIVFYGYTLVL